jgi:hypothetical protein
MIKSFFHKHLSVKIYVSLENNPIKIEGIFMHHHVNQDEFLTSMISIINKIVGLNAMIKSFFVNAININIILPKKTVFNIGLWQGVQQG